jgi:uncharacterized integral membrane protein (TIGR00697 family)
MQSGNIMNKLIETQAPRERRPLEDLSTPPEERPSLRYYDILTVLAATVAVCTNMLALKVTRIGSLTFGGAVVFFPITYILGDVLTEVYGFRRARRVIWLSFGAMLFAAVMSWAVLVMPAAPEKLEIQRHYEAVFSSTPRIFAASLLAFLVGDFLNSIVLARRKVIDQGRAYWKRAILSTVVGQAADSLLFYPLAFAGVWSWELIGTIMVTHYSLKVGVEVLGVPFSYQLVRFLKRAEGVDHYDRITDFNPFGLSVTSQEDTRRTNGPSEQVASGKKEVD